MGSRSFVACAMCALALGAGMFAASFAAGELRAQEDEAFEIGDIYVVGTRRPVRSTADTPAPIDLIAGDDFTDQGTTNLPDLMRTLVPSYNVSTQPISDAATFIRPANLRGLASDQTLIFVNGKRRHRAAVITWLGNGVSEGAQGPDISVIPAIALKRVEVLRDTASAQYGSDAIAGVINYVLKDRPDGGAVETQWGRTYEGDGDEYRIAANAGIPLAENGFANLSVQWHEAEPTVRSVQRADAAGLIAGGNPHVEQPYAQIWGAPDVKGDYTLFLNSGVEVNEGTNVYAFGNFSNRETEGGFFFRNPNSRSGVFYRTVQAGDMLGGRMLEIGDVIQGDGYEYKLEDKNTTIPLRLVGKRNPDATCPREMVVVQNEYFDVEAFNNEHRNCFVFNERFPGGFRPKFKGEVSDSAATTGVRGSFANDMTWDLSYTFGQNEIEFSMRDTINPALGLDTPTRFELGSYTQTEQTANFDVTRPVDISGFGSPLHVAAGLEWRREQFEIGAGERASWVSSDLATEGFGTGSNGFTGFSEQVSGKWSRSNFAGYVDLEADVGSEFTLATMGRVERYQDFGTSTDVKVGALYQVNESFGIRGSASTGFRAPTVGQQNVSNVTTAFIRNDETGLTELSQRGTVPATCPEAAILGAQPLQPEESVTFTAGAVTEAGAVSFTADIYNIEVKDRLGLSDDKKLTAAQKAEVASRGNGCVPASDVINVRYFANGFDTRTRGIDLVATIDVSPAGEFLGEGETELVFVGNWTKTKVVEFDKRYIDDQRIDQLSNALPKVRFNATLRHEQSAWSAFTRVNYFGSYTEWHADSFPVRPGSEITLDAEMSYKPIRGLELSVGAENLLNNFPDELNSFQDKGRPVGSIVGSKYPESSPMGLHGGFYYARARYTF